MLRLDVEQQDRVHLVLAAVGAILLVLGMREGGRFHVLLQLLGSAVLVVEGGLLYQLGILLLQHADAVLEFADLGEERVRLVSDRRLGLLLGGDGQ
ncbi:hypothetical protein LQ757_06170 [Agromyces sp. SYSU K20354]|uniref:hypothetical protein n=1 Tax=Agromyces cavernae TaxID=2898659 RepID=UPI001E5FF779|nr:hypothetical protein [Agromyces cavernae]MCD2441861.1 hypothetical protein [Agromyces cavernae]